MSSFSSTYDKLEVLGEGAYGVAYLVAPRSKGRSVRYVAKEVRVSHLTDKQRDGALAESEVLKMMKHSNIVAHIDTFMEGPRLYIVMEYADGGDLAAKIKDAKEKQDHFEEGEIMFVFVQIALALQHIHAQNVLHRDLKPLNIFLTKQGIVKLGDFGIARVIENSIGAQTTIGTPHYLSPEMVNSEPYGTKSDLWSLGVVLYELAALRVPFHGTSLPAVALQIIGADPEPLPDLYSPKLTKIVFGLLEKEPARRPRLEKVLGSSFVQKYIERNLSHTMNCGNGGLERLSVLAPKSRKELVAPSDAGSAMPAAGKSRHQHRDRLGSEEESQNRMLQIREAEERARKAAQYAWEREFHENRRAAAETKMRVEQDIRIANGGAAAGAASGGSAAALRRQSSGAPARYVPEEERESYMDRGERNKAEVKRKAQERQAQLDAAKWKEHERASREAAEERQRLRQRMQAMQDGGGGMDLADGGDRNEEAAQQVRSRSSPTSSPNRSPQRGAAARNEEDDDRFGVARDDRKAAEEAHLRDLERARRENFLEQQRLREKFAAAMAEDAADGDGDQQLFTRNGSEATAPDEALVADTRPSDGSGGGGGGGGGADEEEDDRRNVEIIIPFSDKVRPKPKLSSDGRAPVSRRRSQSRPEEERGMSGKPSASPGPGARGGGAARLRTNTSRSRASGDESEQDVRRPPRAPQQAGTASGSSNGSAGGRQPAGSPARWLPKCAPPEEDAAGAAGGGGGGGGGGERAEWAAEAVAEDGDLQRPRFDMSLLQDALAGALRSGPSSSATRLSPTAAAGAETEEEEGY